MSVELDPTGAEPRSLSAAVDLGSRRVVEIGSGDGRLTFRIADLPRWVVGLDRDLAAVVQAARSEPRQVVASSSFLPASSLALPFRDGAFDVALFSWSL